MRPPVKSTDQLTLKEFLRLPETKPASEYIDGRIYQKHIPEGTHSVIQSCLPSAINQVSQPKKLAGAFIELICIYGGRALVHDIAVFEWQRIPTDADGRVENLFEIAPDWTIEITSPGESPNLLINKIIFGFNHGTQLSWLVDPEDESVVVFQPNQQPEVNCDSKPLPVLNVLKYLQLSARDLFRWLYFD